MSSDITFFVVLLFFVFSLIVGSYFKDIFNPLIFLTTPLTVQYGLYYFYLTPIHQLSEKTNFLYVLTISSFTFGYLWSLFIPKIKSRRTIEKNNAISIANFEKAKKLFLILGTIGFVLGAYEAVTIGLSGPGSFFFNLRLSGRVNRGIFGDLSLYLMLFLQVITSAMVIFRKKWDVKTTHLLLLVSMLLVSASFTMARTNLLMAISSVLGAYIYSNKYIYKKPIKTRPLIASIIGFTFLSYLFAVGTGKSNGSSNFFFDYIAYPLITFDSRVIDFYLESKGTLTFPLFYKITGILGLTDYATVSISEFLKVPPGHFNTFTLMGAPYLDFGIAGIFFVFFGLGILFGFSYKQVRTGKPSWIIYLSMLLYPLIMSFFEFQFSLTTYVYYAVIILSVHLLRILSRSGNFNKKLMYKKRKIKHI